MAHLLSAEPVRIMNIIMTLVEQLLEQYLKRVLPRRATAQPLLVD
jgi:hypothetical protein